MNYVLNPCKGCLNNPPTLTEPTITCKELAGEKSFCVSPAIVECRICKTTIKLSGNVWDTFAEAQENKDKITKAAIELWGIAEDML